MPATGDIIQFVLDAKQFEQDVKNVFHYVVTIATGLINLIDAIDDFITVVVTPVIAASGDTVTFELVRARNLTDPDEFAQVVVQDNGARVGDQLPSFNAAGFLFTPESAATRPGGKRFAGVREADQNGGTLTAGGLAIWAELEAPLIAALGAGEDWNLSPIILGRAVGGGYELDRYAFIDIATAKEDLTSQTSRKLGRGS